MNCKNCDSTKTLESKRKLTFESKDDRFEDEFPFDVLLVSISCAETMKFFVGTSIFRENYLPETKSSLLKIGLPKRKVVSLLPFFGGYVSFTECIFVGG